MSDMCGIYVYIHESDRYMSVSVREVLLRSIRVVVREGVWRGRVTHNVKTWLLPLSSLSLRYTVNGGLVDGMFRTCLDEAGLAPEESLSLLYIERWD